MTRRRSTAVAAFTAGAVVAGAGMMAATNPAGFVLLDAVDQPLAYWAVGWLLFAAAVALWRPRRLWVLAGAAPVLLVAFVTFGGALLLTAFDVDRHTVAVASRDGQRVRLVEIPDIDPGWEVRVRFWPGPLARERVVLRGTDYVRPETLRFTGPDTVEVLDTEGRAYTATL